MRKNIINTIHSLMEKDESIYFLTGDLGYNAVEEIEKDFGKRFMDVGIAEQNMIGIASGLALSGKKVYVYSIVPFVTMRCFEQIRNDICYHNLDVTILGVGSGLTYGILGSTHFAVEDVGILRTLPNMKIVAPSDGIEAELVVKELYKIGGPAYLRIGKGSETIFDGKLKLEVGKINVVKEGKDIVIFTSGDILVEVLKARELLKGKGVSVEIVDVHTLKPIDEAGVLKCSENKKRIFTVDEHNIYGGLGSIIAEVLAQEKEHAPLSVLAIPDKFADKVGSHKWLKEKYGLSGEKIAQRILDFLQNNK